jgi:uncharacterized protein (DUF2062 family)
MAAGVLLAAVVLSVGSGMALYWLVRRERDSRERMERERAERVARRDTDDRRR